MNHLQDFGQASVHHHASLTISQIAAASITSPASSPDQHTFTEEKEAYVRNGKISLFPYMLRTSKQMAIQYTPVKHLREEAAHEQHDLELAASGVDTNNNKTLSFSVTMKSDQEKRREEQQAEVDKLEKEIARLASQKQTWLEDLERDAEEEKSRNSSVKSTKARRPIPKSPVPVQLDNVPEENQIDCPQCCGNLIDLTKVSQHLQVCSNRQITCPLPGCNDKILYSDISKHKNTTCKVAIKRRKLIEEKRVRDLEKLASPKPKPVEEKFCPEIDMDLVNNSRIRAMLNQELTLMATEDDRSRKAAAAADLFNIFDVDPDIDERAARARVRHGEVACPNCGEPVVLMNLNKHLVNTCINRKVPCRNWELGCPAMVRMRDRATHEKVDDLLKPRPCVKFTGLEGFVDVNETKDLKPPWTAEYWVYRTTPVEAAINLCRKALQAHVDDEQAHKDQIRSEKELEQGQDLLMVAAQKAAKGRDAASLREKDAVTAKLIQLSENHENNQKNAAVRTVEYRMLIKVAAATLAKELTIDQYSELVNDLGPEIIDEEVVASVEGAATDAAAAEEAPPGDEEQEQDGATATTEKSRLDDNETNLPPGADAAAGEAAVAATEETAVVEEAAPDSPPPVEEAAAGASSRPTTVDASRPASANLSRPASRATPHPPIDWHGDGQSLVDKIFQLADAARGKEKAEADEQSSIEEAEKKKKKELERAKKEKAKGKGKGKPMRGNKADRKEKRKTMRENVHGVRIEEQIKELTVGMGGTDVLASSDKFKFSLAVGPQQQLGFSIAGKGDYSVNTTVARGKWTHISYVAFKHKERVAIYMDGRLIGYEDHVKCSLPMRRIGATKHTLHGYVQEVRYWGVQRSKEELKKYMHELLPEDSTANGLLGWWTFEEGAGQFAFDVTEQRYQSKITGRGTRWVTQEDIDAEPPTPAWRERSACKIEIRRAKLAKSGRLQRVITDCPYGCGQSMEKKAIRHHTTYLCQEIAAEKPEWQMRWAVKQRHELAVLGEAQREEVVCPMGCEMTIYKKDVDDHLKKKCEYRLGRCRHPGCGSLIPMIRLEAHEKFFCESDWMVARNGMVKRVRERAGYPTPWIIKQKAAEMGIEGEGIVEELSGGGGGGGSGEGGSGGGDEGKGEFGEFAVGKDAVSVELGEVDESVPFD
jgi:hypothetical protein